MDKEDSYSIVRLPRSFPDSKVFDLAVERTKELRLAALLSDPQFFGSTFAREKDQPYEFWSNRIANPLATTFVAVGCGVLHTSRVATQGFLDGDWMGSIIILGPKDMEEGIKVSVSPWSVLDVTNGSDKPRGYHIAGTFVRPEARGKKVGKKLILTALDWMKQDCRERSMETAQVVLLTDDDNAAARALYTSCGFRVTHQERYFDHQGRNRLCLKMELDLQG